MAKLDCKYNTAGAVILAIGVIYLVVGCASVYDKLGFTEDEINELTAADRALVRQAIEGGREWIWQMATVATSGLGAILSGLLGTWLRKERKINTAIIAGVEAADKSPVKEAIKREALSAGVESSLHKRVLALTG